MGFENNVFTERILGSERYGLAQIGLDAGIYPYYRVVQSPPGPEITVEGQRRVNLGSNNYLGLAEDPRVIEATARAASRYGAGVGGSRLLNGTLDLHLELEADIQRCFGADRALVASTGYVTNLSLLSGLLTSDDLAVVDVESHNSIQTALTLSRAKVATFSHNDPEKAAQVLRSAPPEQGKVIVVDGIYSMKGDLAPLRELLALRDETPNTLLVVDEAHGFGVCGESGLGACELTGILSEVDFITITFSKSLGSCGGAIITRHGELLDGLRLIARMNPFVFTASNTPGSLGAALESLRIIQQEPDRVRRLRTNVDAFVDRVASYGIPIAPSVSGIVVVPLKNGDDLSTIAVGDDLLNAGVYANTVLYPAVPRNCGLLRFSFMSSLSEDQIGFAADCLYRVLSDSDQIADQPSSQAERELTDD